MIVLRYMMEAIIFQSLLTTNANNSFWRSLYAGNFNEDIENILSRIKVHVKTDENNDMEKPPFSLSRLLAKY